MRLSLVHRSRLPVLLVAVLILALTTEAKKKEPPTKSVHGHVVDSRKKSIVGAKVFIRNVSKKTTTTLVTDEDGLYAIYGLDPKVDYEVHAEYGKFVSETKSISSFLNRFDNVFNFELGPSTSSAAGSSVSVSGQPVQLTTPDHLKLSGEWNTPSNGETKFPAVLLFHGLGQDRRQWDGLVRDRLLPAGFAALTLDLRGHGGSKEKAGVSATPQAPSVSDPPQFPLDVQAAIQWLKSRNDVDVNRIAVIGCDLGGDLAFLASGKYEEVRSAVAISANAGNATTLTKSIPDFQPHAILYIATQGDLQGASSARELEKRTGFPVRVQIYENSSDRGIKILQEIPEATALILDWLKKM